MTLRVEQHDKCPLCEVADGTSTVEAIAVGTLKVPANRIAPFRMSVGNGPECAFGDVGFLSHYQYRLACGEIMAFAYAHLCAMACYDIDPMLRWRRKSLPPVKGTAEDLRCRTFTAAVEGLLYGLATWDSAKHADKTCEAALRALFGHTMFWADQYAEWEACVIRAEREGALAEAELTLRDKLGTRYRDARAASVACGRYAQEYGSLPSKRALSEYIEERGYGRSRTIANAKRALAYVADGSLPDLVALYCLRVGDDPDMLGSLGPAPELYDALEVLARLRHELMDELARGGVLTPDVAETVDLLYFGAVPVESHEYTGEDTVAACTVVRDKLRKLRSPRRLAELERELIELEASNVVVVPSPGGVFSVGMVRFPAGPEDSLACRHLRRSSRWSAVAAVALELICRRVIEELPGLSRDSAYRLIEPADFSETVETVRAVEALIRRRGYLDVESARCLPTVREVRRLSEGYFPVALRTCEGDALYVCEGSVAKPMMAWQRETAIRSIGGGRFDVRSMYSAIEDMKRFDDACSVAGRTESRYVYVRCGAAEADVSVERERVTSKFGKRAVSTVKAHYRRELRELPKTNIRVGDSRIPGAPAPTRRVPVVPASLSLSRGI